MIVTYAEICKQINLQDSDGHCCRMTSIRVISCTLAYEISGVPMQGCVQRQKSIKDEPKKTTVSGFRLLL